MNWGGILKTADEMFRELGFDKMEIAGGGEVAARYVHMVENGWYQFAISKDGWAMMLLVEEENGEMKERMAAISPEVAKAYVRKLEEMRNE